MGSCNFPVRCHTKNSILRLLNSIAGVQSGLLGLSFGLLYLCFEENSSERVARPPSKLQGGCFPEPENFFCCGFAFGADKCPENRYLFKNSRISQGRSIKTVVITAPSSRGRRKGAGQQGGGASGFWARSEASLIF